MENELAEVAIEGEQDALLLACQLQQLVITGTDEHLSSMDDVVAMLSQPENDDRREVLVGEVRSVTKLFPSAATDGSNLRERPPPRRRVPLGRVLRSG